MEKLTKKKAKKKGLKKRIGLIAIGGLSLVLTVCLSVGATLAWFAGSTHASKSLFMGGPVYVEMSGREGTDWTGGAGKLDITTFSRTTGTVGDADDFADILLPGQGFAIYSQARVYSTSSQGSVIDNATKENKNSGSDITNSTQTAASGNLISGKSGNVTTTTSSVLRARFSVSVEFDPSVGYNNFTGTDYANGYPKQSTNTKTDPKDYNTPDVAESGLKEQDWKTALQKPATGGTYTATTRRDTVKDIDGGKDAEENYIKFTDDVTTKATLQDIKDGKQKSIYAWKFVSKAVYEDETQTADVGADSLATDSASVKYCRMGAPFDGTGATASEKYYGVWILKDGKLSESDAFYKARCNAYIQTYVEQYTTEYDSIVERTIGKSLEALETSLNTSFVNLVNDSSNAIIAGYLNGMNTEGTVMSYKDALDDKDAYMTGTTKASWLYIDPTIGNDTNTNELSTSTGGWWYLVECDNGYVADGASTGTGSAIAATANKVYTAWDEVSQGTTSGIYDGTKIWKATTAGVKDTTDTDGTAVTTDALGNTQLTSTSKSGTPFSRGGVSETSETRKTAKLYEIKPGTPTAKTLSSKAVKTVSYSFPFVNGRTVLEGDPITNVFANAKISIQISFQAIQAFFPYSTNIDNMNYKNTLLGTSKALTIGNAIPIFNEAFDYYENYSGQVSGL